MMTKAENNGKQWSAKEDERLRELAVSSATLSEIAEKLKSNKVSHPGAGIHAPRGTTAFSNPAALPVEMGLKVKGK